MKLRSLHKQLQEGLAYQLLLFMIMKLVSTMIIYCRHGKSHKAFILKITIGKFPGMVMLKNM